MRHILLEVHCLEGNHEGRPLRLVVADDGYTLGYIRNLVFPAGASDSTRGKVSAFAAPRLANADADLVVVGANQLLVSLYRRRGFLLIPRWVRLFLAAREHPDLMFADADRPTRKYFRRMRRTIQDGGYACEVTTDPHWLDQFYNGMYRPYALRRFGSLAVVHGYREVRRNFLRGAAIVVKKADSPVAAAVVFRHGDMLCVPHMGVAGGEVELGRQGACMALDYYAAGLAHSIGCTLVNFGHARPFLCDGVLRHKMYWHMEVREDDDSVGVFAVASPGATEHARRFLSEHPFYRHTKLGLVLHQQSQQPK